jgi:hypothetical protein
VCLDSTDAGVKENWSNKQFSQSMQLPGTMGLLINPNHLALANFPTEIHSNWQWWDFMQKIQNGLC